MRKDNPLLVGILLTIGAGFVFSGMDALGKQLTLLLPIVQVVWGRYFVQTVILGAYLSFRTGTGFLRTSHPYLQLARGLILLATTFLMYEALKRVPLADATAVLFFSPIVVTILSVLVLRERIGPHRILAVLAGFGGMMLILSPGFGTFHPALLLVLAASVLNAVYLLLTRHLAGREDAAATQFNTTAAGAVILSLLVAPNWQTPDLGAGLLLVAIGVFGTVGHFVLVRAFAHAPASLLSPFLYSQVIGASLLSVTLFGDPLRPAMMAGTVILVSSGLYIWWRENRRRLETI